MYIREAESGAVTDGDGMPQKFLETLHHSPALGIPSDMASASRRHYIICGRFLAWFKRLVQATPGHIALERSRDFSWNGPNVRSLNFTAFVSPSFDLLRLPMHLRCLLLFTFLRSFYRVRPDDAESVSFFCERGYTHESKCPRAKPTFSGPQFFMLPKLLSPRAPAHDPVGKFQGLSPSLTIEAEKNPPLLSEDSRIRASRADGALMNEFPHWLPRKKVRNQKTR